MFADIVARKAQVEKWAKGRVALGGKCPPNYEDWWTNWERHPFEVPPSWPGTMTLTAYPKTVALSEPVSVTISVEDSTKKTPITNASVLLNGTVVGPAGVAFTHTFLPNVSVDPVTHTRTESAPTCTVRERLPRPERADQVPGCWRTLTKRAGSRRAKEAAKPVEFRSFARRVSMPWPYGYYPRPSRATPAIRGTADGSARGIPGSLLSTASSAPGTAGSRWTG